MPPEGAGALVPDAEAYQFPLGIQFITRAEPSLPIAVTMPGLVPQFSLRRRMAPLSEPERRDFWEICEDRYQVRSLILTSQSPVTRWHEQIGDPTVADGILDRLVHNAHRIEMRGDSMRKNRGKTNV